MHTSIHIGLLLKFHIIIYLNSMLHTNPDLLSLSEKLQTANRTVIHEKRR